ncbi:MAG: DUF853 family protein [Anaerolineae bacterium]|jgi:hypothetical protein|nr:DUF853 family protein [Anaerolineae bacterium]MBT4458302.1 DUF853 family protein [Anaerolineae bacterium]MBT4841679.1 DUF853 family protein [Anaerolineae bacterium]MBT6061829.1 DUF853 family protein [Anaerolineae bacterium]MBT6322682.1 DUF853 family protein [Anaerolineae bacterium]
MPKSKFYLGRTLENPQAEPRDEALYYDPPDLTTHAIVTGMTGSGKTGLCVTLLEEAALQGIPALIIDPKGDLTNLLLHFPDLAPQDFEPWLDPETARRSGKSVAETASETAKMWKDGLEKWDIDSSRLRALKNAAQFAVYTPGSDAGIPISVLSSLAVPDMDWKSNREILREKISSTVTALLGLIGEDDLDPLRSREHILLSHIFENAWSKGKSLDLTELILQTQNPPFDKLGALPVDSFFPAKARTALVMQLNAILAAPSFETWREGQALDIPDLLYTPEGKPRHSVFYLAHLSETERMFFVTLLFSAVETWMRTQSGATSLRALLYMDEIYGYLPPQKNPPSKPPLLRMLKQARAFGVGLMLATQNPVDVDYKALSNAGTWFIGKLQTEQDKARLLDGLESAAGGLNRRAYDKLISSLGKRSFILHNVHEKQPALFRTRWAMNYLAGPMTRAQIPALNGLVNAQWLEPEDAQEMPSKLEDTGESLASYQPVSVKKTPRRPERKRVKHPHDGSSETRPAIPSSFSEHFLPFNLSLAEAFDAANRPLSVDAEQVGIVYRPSLLASATVRFLNRKHGVDSEISRSRLVANPDPRGVVRWDDFGSVQSDLLTRMPAPQSRFVGLEPPLSTAKLMNALKRDFKDWLYRSTTLKARANVKLKIYAGPEISKSEFMRLCADAAREKRDTEIDKISDGYERKLDTLENRLKREERELRQDEDELSDRKMEEMGTHAENVLSMFSKRRRRMTTSLTKRRLTQQAKADVEESIEAIDDYERQIRDLEAEFKEKLDEIGDRWGGVVNEISEVSLKPTKTNIFVDDFGVAWMPYYLVEVGGQRVEVPAFG